MEVRVQSGSITATTRAARQPKVISNTVSTRPMPMSRFLATPSRRSVV